MQSTLSGLCTEQCTHGAHSSIAQSLSAWSCALSHLKSLTRTGYSLFLLSFAAQSSESMRSDARQQCTLVIDASTHTATQWHELSTQSDYSHPLAGTTDRPESDSHMLPLVNTGVTHHGTALNTEFTVLTHVCPSTNLLTRQFQVLAATQRTSRTRGLTSTLDVSCQSDK